MKYVCLYLMYGRLGSIHNLLFSIDQENRLRSNWRCCLLPVAIYKSSCQRLLKYCDSKKITRWQLL